MKHVYCTLAADMVYAAWGKGPDGRTVEQIHEQSVAINGGAGIASRHLITPRGVHTQITDEQYAALQNNPIFQLHVKNGFITVDDRLVDVDKVVADMTARDESAPLVPEDFPESGPQPVVDGDTGGEVIRGRRGRV